VSTDHGQTPSQAIGPFFAHGLIPEQYGYAFTSLAGTALASERTMGERVRIQGQVLDGEAVPVADALVEIWQADAEGRYMHPAAPPRNVEFTGFGRAGTGADPHNRFLFDTIKPGAPQTGHAPHIHVFVFMPGLLNHVSTRLYFSDETSANERDNVLQSIAAVRRNTLIALREQSDEGAVYRFDIHMQGPLETVFFDL